jgi:hypothetical protein
MPQPKRTLPNFAKRDYNKALRLATDILTGTQTEKTSLIQLTEFEDGHFRAVFKSSYFVIAEGQEQPSKSQWNTLKKKFKRHDRLMFVFKEHGVISKNKNDSSINYYIDFGFFAD